MEKLPQPEVQLIFFRHGKEWYKGSQEEKGLLGLATIEVDAIRKSFEAQEGVDINPERSVLFYKNNHRSKHTGAIWLDKTSTPKLLNTFKAKSKNYLGYTTIDDTPIAKLVQLQIDSACSQFKNLEFMINQLDSISSEIEITNYGKIRLDFINLIKKYYKVSKSLQKIIQSKPINENLDFIDIQRLFCGNEFILAGFCAFVYEIYGGKKFRDEFINWYTQNIENPKTNDNEYQGRDFVVMVKIIGDNLVFSCNFNNRENISIPIKSILNWVI